MSHHKTDTCNFIDPRAVLMVRIVFGMLVTLVLAGILLGRLLPASAEPIEFQTHSIQGSEQVLSGSILTKPLSASVPEPEQKVPKIIAESNHAKKAMSEPKIAKQHQPEQNESQQPVMQRTNQKVNSDDNVQHRETEFDRNPIIAGETAPHYRFRTLAEYLHTARTHGGQLVAYDGTIAVQIGKSLEFDRSQIRLLDSTWHQIYAKRMAPLPQTAETLAAIAKVCRTYTSLERSQTRIVLSLPHAVDRRIFESQVQWFSNKNLLLDVTKITEGRVSDAGRFAKFEIHDVVDLVRTHR